MATVTKRIRSRAESKAAVPPLHTGDRLTQPEFHRRYEQYPDDVRFELISGIVYMASPVGDSHSEYDNAIGATLFHYRSWTPGVVSAQNGTVVLGPQSETQPDGILRVLPEYGGRTKTTADGYLAGGPELVVEVAHSSISIDLHAKRDAYRLAGVQEYIVVCVEECEVRWFDLPADRELPVDAQGILRSRMFPGFWLDTAALLRHDGQRLIEVVEQGLASGEHAKFVKQLESQFTKSHASENPPVKPKRKKRP